MKGREPGLGELVASQAEGGRLRATTEYRPCGEAEVVIAAVETPIAAATKRPAYGALKSALASLAANMPGDGLVSIESTLAPGTMANVVMPALESSGRKKGRDFNLIHCPERLTAGKLLYNLTNLDRVLGARDEEGRRRGVELYSSITKAKVHTTDWLTAEVVKTVENAYWNVLLAFAKEVGLLSEALGVDAHEVRELVNSSPSVRSSSPGPGWVATAFPRTRGCSWRGPTVGSHASSGWPGRALRSGAP